MKNFLINRFLFVLLIVSIPIDVLNGYFQVLAGFHAPISIVFRGCVLFYILTKFVLHKQINSLVYIALLGVYVYALSFSLWMILEDQFSLVDELMAGFKIVYFVLIILFFITYRKYCDRERVLRLIILSAFVIALINIICFVTGWGIKSYNDERLLGTSGFFVDGNSMGIQMLLSLCVSVYYAFRCNKLKWYLVAMVITLGCMALGSRSGLIGPVGIWIVLLVYNFLNMQTKWMHRILTLIILGGITYGVTTYFEMVMSFDVYAVERYSSEALISPRKLLQETGESVIHGYKGHELLIGKGCMESRKLVAEKMQMAEPKNIESDFHDQILAYGWGLGGLFCLLHVAICFSFLHAWIKRKNSLNMIVSFLGVIWLALSYMGGHGFFNVAIAPLLGSGFALMVKRGEDINFMKTNH